MPWCVRPRQGQLRCQPGVSTLHVWLGQGRQGLQAGAQAVGGPGKKNELASLVFWGFRLINPEAGRGLAVGLEVLLSIKAFAPPQPPCSVKLPTAREWQKRLSLCSVFVKLHCRADALV